MANFIGHPAWNKGMSGYAINVKYSGGYSSVHAWLKRRFGRAIKCESKTCKGISSRFEWALKKGRKYDYKKRIS